MAALAYRFNMSCIVMLMLIWLTNPLLHTSHRTIDGPAFTRRPPYGALPVLPLSNRYHPLTLPQHLQTTWVFVANNFPPIASSCQLHHSSIRTTSWHRTFLPSPNKPARPVRYLPFTILELQTAKLTHLFLSRQANLADTRQLPSNAQFAKRVCAFPPSPSSNVRRVRYHLQPTIFGKQPAKSHLFIPPYGAILENQTANLTHLFPPRQATSIFFWTHTTINNSDRSIDRTYHHEPLPSDS